MSVPRNFKTDYKQVLLALKADIKAYGGYQAAAENVSVTHDTLCCQVNPNSDVNPPSLSTFLELINTIQAKRTVASIAGLVDQITIDQHDCETLTNDEIKTFLSLVSSASQLLNKGSEFAMDNRFDAGEREKLLPLLMTLMQVTGQLYRRLNR